MADPVVHLTNGVPDSGTGNITTLGQVMLGGIALQDGAVGTKVAVKAGSTAPAAADPALVVALSPNAVNPNGQTSMASSAPVAIANNQTTLSVAPDTSQVANGATGTYLTPAKARINVSTASTTTLVAGVAAKKVRILSMYLISAAANIITLQSHTTTANSDSGCSYAANGGISLPFNPVGWFDTTAGEALDMVTSAAGQVAGQLTYIMV